MIIELPWPPSVNAYWTERAVFAKGPKKTTKTKGQLAVQKVLSDRGREFRRAGIEACMVQRVIHKNLQGPLAMKIELYPPSHRRFDVDNFNKGILDCLTHARVYGDDSQVEDLHIRKMCKFPGGKVIVELEPFGNPQSAHNQIDLLSVPGHGDD